MYNWIAYRTALRRCLTGGLALLLVLTTMFFAVEHAFAQEPGSQPNPRRDSIATRASAIPLLPITASLPRPTLKPPAPIAEPQVGPLIKRAPMSDIEHRTTAFLPTADDLARLTPVEIPDEDRWIRVDLSEQITIAYENGRAVRGFVISSGLPRTPTVQGEYRIRTKVRTQTMSGGSGAYYYNLPNVQWVQYFYAEYAFHGSYWHSDFGIPKSRGCINMTNADAKWLFDWAGPVWDGKTTWYKSTTDNPGTLVIVHE